MDKGIYNSHNNNSNDRSTHYNQNNNIYILNSDQTILSHGTDIFNTNSSSYAGYHYGPIPQTLTNQSSKPLAYTSSFSSLSSNVTPCTTSTASMCSPAANALQKLFKCSTSLMTNKSNHNTKHQNHHHRHRHHHSRLQQQQQQQQQQQHQQQREQQPNAEHAESSSLLSRACIGSTYTFIGSNKTLKTNLSGNKSQLLAKKTKFWKLLENEGMKSSKSSQANGNFKYWHECCNGDKMKHLSPQHKNSEDLWPLTCSLCDNCRCMDCQSGYFDYDYDTDSDSEYSLHLSDNEFESQNFDLIGLQKLDLTDDNCNECQRQLDEGKRNQPTINNVKDNKINSYNSSKQKITNKSTVGNDDESSSVCLLANQSQNLNAFE